MVYAIAIYQTIKNINKYI